MGFPVNKTKIVCTIGPASEQVHIMENMLHAGMNVARLNFSHGYFEQHSEVITRLRTACENTGKRLAIMGDLPGPKIRIGMLEEEPIELEHGNRFVLTTAEILGDTQKVSVSFKELPRATRPGDIIYLNDGLIQLQVLEILGEDVICKVVVGGVLRSKKGLNLPGIDLGITAFTEMDKRFLEFAADHKLDALSQSFVESRKDLDLLRSAASEIGYRPFIVAKIERARALDRIDEIIDAADALMIARGDLGVETPIEQIALLQKELIRKANQARKPIITATQMLESMTQSRRPTRAESTDVANAVLDGTDCVMLSGESALGIYPVESVEMLAKIAASVEPMLSNRTSFENLRRQQSGETVKMRDLLASSIQNTIEKVSASAIFVPTRSGATARSVAAFRLPVWITAISPLRETCQRLQFTYGVYSKHMSEDPEDWRSFANEWFAEQQIDGDLVIVTEGPSRKRPEAYHRMEIIQLRTSCNYLEEDLDDFCND